MDARNPFLTHSPRLAWLLLPCALAAACMQAPGASHGTAPAEAGVWPNEPDTIDAVILDRTIACPLHHTKLVDVVVRTHGGMPLDYGEHYQEAIRRFFPYSRWAPQSYSCLDPGMGDILLPVCKTCRFFERAWRMHRGWRIDPMGVPTWGRS